MPMKIIWSFRLANRGWTESYYVATEDPVPWLQQRLTQEHVNTRLRLASPAVILQSVKAIRTDGSRVAGERQFATIGQGGVTTFEPDNPTTSALIRCRASSGRVRHVWLRGLIDGQTHWNAQLLSQPNANLRNALTAWQNEIVREYDLQAWIPTPATQPWAIVQVSAWPTNVLWSRLTLSTDQHGIEVGHVINVTRVPQFLAPGLSGRFDVLAVAGPDVIVAYRSPAGTPIDLLRPGQVRRVQVQFQGIIFATFVRFSTRDTGRPTGVPRGRGRAVRRLL